MPVNDKINYPDYNNIKAKIDAVLGSGSGNSGYGQSLRSSNVGESNRVTVNEWANLRYDIINAYKHIFGSVPTIVLPATGNTVRYSNTFVPDSGASDAPVTQFDTYCNTITANRFTVNASQSATQSIGSSSTTYPGAYGSYWTSRVACTINLSWPNSNQARYFFNSGGEIRIAVSRSGGSSTQQNTSWTNILNSAGTRSFGGNLPGAGTTPSDATNFYRCTSSYQQWYTISGSSPYGSNSYRIYARTPGAAVNSSGTSSTLDFQLEFIDNYTDPGNYFEDSPNTIDAVDGTFSVSVSCLYATGVLEPTGSGNFTVQLPTTTVSAVQP